MKRKTTRPASAPAADDPEADAAAGRDAVTTRRRFLELAAAGSVALLVGSRPSAAATTPARRRTKPPAAAPAPAPTSTALRKEIDSQKEYLARALKTVREYPLPPGSEMAFAFRPLAASPPSREKRSGGKS